MASRPAVPNVIKHQLMWTFIPTGDLLLNTIWVEHDDTPTQDMCDADRTVLRSWAEAWWESISSESYRLDSVKSWRFDTTPPAKYLTDNVYPSSDISGDHSAAGLPPQTAAVISLRTGEEGVSEKPPHGRVYHVGISYDYVSNEGRILGTNVDTVLECWDALRTGLNFTGDIGRWVVISFWAGGSRESPNPRPAPLVLPVTHLQMPAYLATVRSRRPHQLVYAGN